MTDGIVFVHGGGHGKWCWDKVRAELTIPSIAVDLPGRGDRPYDGSLVTLDRCVDAVMEDVQREGFERFALVGHSMGGLTITEVAHRNPDRVDHLLYLDAVAYLEGVNQLTFTARVLGYVPEISDPTALSPGFDRHTARQLFMSDLPDDEFKEAYAKLSPEPYGLWFASVGGLCPDIPTTYIMCLKGADGGRYPKDYTVDILRRACRDFTYVELEADHDVMLSQPDRVRDYVVAMATGGRVSGP